MNKEDNTMWRLVFTAATFLSLLFLPFIGSAQNDKESYQEYKKRMEKEYNSFKRQKHDEYEDFRKKANDDYAEFVRQHWEELEAMGAKRPPKEKTIPPVVCPEEEKNKQKKNRETPYDNIINIKKDKSQPQPISPIENNLDDDVNTNRTLSLSFYGTPIRIKIAKDAPEVSLKGIKENDIANGWELLSKYGYDNVVKQCLDLRSKLKLNDWAYLQLIDIISTTIIGQTNNSSTLLMAWIYCQSGYRMRLAKNNNQLYMLFASENTLYNYQYFPIDNKKYYPYNAKNVSTLYICKASFPKEQNMSLRIEHEPELTLKKTTLRTLQSKRYPTVKASVSVNKNLIDFYNNYPNASLDDFFGSRWAMYANTPLCSEAQSHLYPALRQKIQGKNKLQAAEELLNFVQTSLVYEYDSIVWGGDRAFFPEETLFYPYADCEDRAILYSLIVRDLLGLKVVLIYYPGHLATAIHFENETPSGDYIHLDDGNYFIADPTYIGATIGMTMPAVRNKKITVIRIDN